MMKRVSLKPNSTDFADDQNTHKPHIRMCDMPGCQDKGEYRAPKDRSLSDHYWFCQEHAREYNKAWNYFSGMSDSEMQSYMKESLYGFRQTRPFSDLHKSAEDIERELHNFRYGADAKFERQSSKEKRHSIREDEHTQERDALKELGLEETLDFDVIKKRYKELAKKLHPDINPDDAEAEDKLKKVNMAYTILKLAFSGQSLGVN